MSVPFDSGLVRRPHPANARGARPVWPTGYRSWVVRAVYGPGPDPKPEPACNTASPQVGHHPVRSGRRGSAGALLVSDVAGRPRQEPPHIGGLPGGQIGEVGG